MKILFLGPPCLPMEACLAEKGHTFVRMEKPLSLDWIQEQHFDFGVSYRYKHIVKKNVIEFFSGKLINMHISLLPWNRGMDPNLWSHIDNTPKGVTIHRMDAGIDTGDILLQQEVLIDPEFDTLRTSYDKLSQTIEELFITNIEALFAGTISAVPQNGMGSFHFAKDKRPYLHLIDESGFDMTICKLLHKLTNINEGGDS